MVRNIYSAEQIQLKQKNLSIKMVTLFILANINFQKLPVSKGIRCRKNLHGGIDQFIIERYKLRLALSSTRTANYQQLVRKNIRK